MIALFHNGIKKEGAFYMVKMPPYESSCLETGVKTLVTETGQQLPPSIADFQKNILIVLTAFPLELKNKWYLIWKPL